MLEAHLIGNGSSAWLFDHKSPGLRLTCNLPPFSVDKAIGTCLVDFKVMKAIEDGSVQIPGDWIMGARPKKYCEQNSLFYMKFASHIKEFYTILPKYVPNYTDFSCGHMACHYLVSKHKPDVIHMYGFDSMFEFDLRSCTDFYLNSNRDNATTLRLTNNWRSIWPDIFREFKKTNFKIHSKHSSIKFDLPKNAEIILHK